MPSVTLYGGKGGVGKTTCAAATGVAAARAGESTLVVSTDPAHSLSDAFGTAVGAGPTEVRPNLWAVETDPEASLEAYRRVFERLTEDLTSVGVRLGDDGMGDLFASGLLPGSDELAALDRLAAIPGSDYDRVVVDTAPTGHTLRLLEMPSAVGRGVETARSVGEQVRRKANAARTLVFGPYASGRRDDDGEAFDAVLEDMATVTDLLKDEARTEFRVVCLPERMVITETERLVTQLRAAGIPVGRLVVNRVLEERPGDCERCLARWESQQTALEEIDDRFPDLERSVLPDLTGARDGGGSIDRLAERLPV
jgi:arsenite-transporting ATPase